MTMHDQPTSYSPPNSPINSMSKEVSKTIQRVEITKHEIPIHCPFCGVETYKPASADYLAIVKCEHLLFYAHDMEIEYRSKRFDDSMGIAGLSGEEIPMNDKGVDGFTDNVNIQDAVKFAFYQGAPSFYGTYVGYAPVQE